MNEFDLMTADRDFKCEKCQSPVAIGDPWIRYNKWKVGPRLLSARVCSSCHDKQTDAGMREPAPVLTSNGDDIAKSIQSQTSQPVKPSQDFIGYFNRLIDKVEQHDLLLDSKIDSLLLKFDKFSKSHAELENKIELQARRLTARESFDRIVHGDKSEPIKMDSEGTEPPETENNVYKLPEDVIPIFESSEEIPF